MAGIVTGVAVTALLATAVIALPRGNVGPTTQADPFGGPAAVEFRAGERGLTVARPIRSSDRQPSSSGPASAA